ncbi:MAG: hypothetical protein ABII00_18795 [Elusimicrobiota bacterium]
MSQRKSPRRADRILTWLLAVSSVGAFAALAAVGWRGLAPSETAVFELWFFSIWIMLHFVLSYALAARHLERAGARPRFMRGLLAAAAFTGVICLSAWHAKEMAHRTRRCSGILQAERERIERDEPANPRWATKVDYCGRWTYRLGLNGLPERRPRFRLEDWIREHGTAPTFEPPPGAR